MRRKESPALVWLMMIGLLVTTAYTQENPGFIFLVRHAEKASDAKDALLSDKGQRRAQCLAHILQDAEIRGIYVTEVVRTQQTAQPLAKARGLNPIVVGADDLDTIVKDLRSDAGKNILLVGHSDPVPKILERLGAGKPAMEAWEYDKLFIFRGGANGQKGSVVTLRYCDGER